MVSSIVWFDAYISNVDRTPRNTNMLFWHKRLVLIDHGAALYFHHAGSAYLERSRAPFSPIKQHVLLPRASRLTEVDALFKAKLPPEKIEEIVGWIPDDWLNEDPQFVDHEVHRAAYVAYLLDRLAHSHIFVEEAMHARAQFV